VVQTLESVLASWPREDMHGFLVHFSNRFRESKYISDNLLKQRGKLSVRDKIICLTNTLVGLIQFPTYSTQAAGRPQRVFYHRLNYSGGKYKNFEDTNSLQTLGALFAGNYFGGEVLAHTILSRANSPQAASLAQDLLESVQWADAIKAGDNPRIFPIGGT
jgi:hypothetical protein